jgi:hypothetical protein
MQAARSHAGSCTQMLRTDCASTKAETPEQQQQPQQHQHKRQQQQKHQQQ